MTFQSLCRAWNNFWFAQQSPLPVAAFRIALGLIVIYLCFLLAPNVPALFGAHAIVSVTTMNDWWGGRPELNLLSLLPASDESAWAAFALLLAAGICLVCGFFSRSAAFTVFLIMLSLDSRNHFVFHPAFALLRVMALYLALSPCGEALSLHKIWTAGNNPSAGSHRQSKLCPVWPQRLMQLQIVAVYWSSLSFQFQGAAWMNGSAVYFATHLQAFQRLTVPYIFEQMPTCNLLGWTTMVLELCLCTLLWIKEFRYAALLAGFLFHSAIECKMVFIPLLQHLMAASYLLFVDPQHLLILFSKIQLGWRALTVKFIPRQQT